MRILLLTSSREITDRAALAAILKPRYDADPDTELWHGDAPGGDSLSDALWVYWGGREPKKFPAGWKHCAVWCPPNHQIWKPSVGWYCLTAGTRRNQTMVDAATRERAAGAEVECVAIRQYGAGNVGTNDCARRAKQVGIKVDKRMIGEPQLTIEEAS